MKKGLLATLNRYFSWSQQMDTHGGKEVGQMHFKDFLQRIKCQFFSLQILHDQVTFYVETGARTAHLFSVEWYNNLVILTPLNPCLAVNSDTVEASGDELLIKQSIYQNTVKVR